MEIELKNGFIIKDDGSGYNLSRNTNKKDKDTGKDIYEAVCYPKTLRRAICNYCKILVTENKEKTDLNGYVDRFENLIKELNIGNYLE